MTRTGTAKLGDVVQDRGDASAVEAETLAVEGHRAPGRAGCARWSNRSGPRTHPVAKSRRKNGAPRDGHPGRQGESFMAVMMRSMLEVADNSGARKLQVILPLGGVDRTGGPPGRRGDGFGEGSFAGRHRQEGHGGEGRDRAHPQRASPARRHLHPLRLRMRRC